MARSSHASAALRIGYAGWSIPSAQAGRFPGEGSHLERYARVFDAVEINSSFYRPHRPATYARWAASVPPGFRFSVKIPRAISHDARLRDCDALLDNFLDQVTHLGDRLGCLLLQLPPSMGWDPDTVLPFLERLRGRHAGAVACEPRHASWFDRRVDRALANWNVARVAADPARTPRAAVPSGDRNWAYLRLHGSPRMYYDAYPPAALERIAARWQRLRPAGPCWCIFDNTAHGHATGDALALLHRIVAPARHDLEPRPGADSAHSMRLSVSSRRTK